MLKSMSDKGATWATIYPGDNFPEGAVRAFLDRPLNSKGDTSNKSDSYVALWLVFSTFIISQKSAPFEKIFKNFSKPEVEQYYVQGRIKVPWDWKQNVKMWPKYWKNSFICCLNKENLILSRIKPIESVKTDLILTWNMLRHD